MDPILGHDDKGKPLHGRIFAPERLHTQIDLEFPSGSGRESLRVESWDAHRLLMWVWWVSVRGKLTTQRAVPPEYGKAHGPLESAE